MSWFGWFWDILGALNLYSRRGKIILLGLDNSGKTTLLHILRDERLSVHTPTMHPTMEEIKIGNLTLTTFDLGGHEVARRLWREYGATSDAIVFIVDAHDSERLGEAKRELCALLTASDLVTVPILVFGNKIDLPRALSEAELRSALGLEQTTGSERTNEGVRPLEVFMTSIVHRSGYKEGFAWLARQLK
jgi:GTP-binding protein SAR1